MTIPNIETDRLLIREYTPADLDSRHRLIREAFNVTDQKIEETQSWLAWTVANYRELAALYQPPYGDYAIVLKSSGAVIGSVGLVQTIVPWGVFKESPDERTYFVTPEFGLYWAILPEYWGKGYAGEATQAFIGRMFQQINMARLVATTDHDNLNSQRVMQKLGMTLMKNPGSEPFWFEVVGILNNPASATAIS